MEIKSRAYVNKYIFNKNNLLSAGKGLGNYKCFFAVIIETEYVLVMNIYI